jgi:hypothetical protein
MELEANGPRLDVPHTRKEQGGENIAIRKSLLDSRADFFE